MSMKHRGPRDWSPRPPDLEDIKEALEVWESFEWDVDELSEATKNIQRYFSKAKSWIKGSKPDKKDVFELLVAIGSVQKRLMDLTVDAAEILPPSKAIAEMFRKIEKES